LPPLCHFSCNLYINAKAVGFIKPTAFVSL
jgi:hypothetical protein